LHSRFGARCSALPTSMSPTPKQIVRLIWLAGVVVVVAVVVTGLLGYRLWRELRAERFDPVGLVSPNAGFDPSWSDDGRRIVYRKAPSDPRKWNPPEDPDVLEVWDLEQRSCRSVVVKQSNRVELFWPWFGDTADDVLAIATWPWGGKVEKPLVANSRLQSAKQVWRIDLSSGEPRLVWKGFGKALFLRWDQTYRKGVVVMYKRRSQAGLPRRPDISLALVAADGRAEAQTGTVSQAWPLTQCDLIDGNTAVFCATDEVGGKQPWVPTSMHFATVDFRNGKVRTQSPTVNGVIYSLRLSSDKTRVAYVVAAPKAETWRVVVRRLDGGSEVTVARDAWPLSCVGWSPDGQYVAYTSDEDRKIHIVSSRAKKQQHRVNAD
jgi:hypothetical protein